jgi:hypothetical protein
MDNEITHRLREIVWQYADRDPIALSILRGRIAETGRTFGLISYSDIVKGIDFHYPNINGGNSYRIDTYDWSGLDRRIIGDCLGYLSAESFLEAGFMCSALVIGRDKSKPSDIFFEWMHQLGVLPDTNEDTVLTFWSEQVNKAHRWYKYGERS